MGKSSKPLVLVIEASIDGPTFDVLREQGHKVTHFAGVYDPTLAFYEDVDLILGPRCWMMTPEVAENPKLLDAAIKQGRVVRYGMENKKEVKGKDTKKPAKTGKGRPAKGTKSSTVPTGDAPGGTGTEVQPNQTSLFS